MGSELRGVVSGPELSRSQDMRLSQRLTPLQQEILRNSLKKSAHLEALNAQLKVVEAAQERGFSWRLTIVMFT